RVRLASVLGINLHEPDGDDQLDAALMDPSGVRSRNQSAELLYLMLSLAYDGDEPFTAQPGRPPTADTDDDSLLEFVDGWGNPIEWLRWPAGYLEADPQGAPSDWVLITDMQTGDAASDPDPFGF